jgi:2-polyprenyl-3-methyl-5-hydroxy-6-metoxy-1,4-benzoquinol methylase
VSNCLLCDSADLALKCEFSATRIAHAWKESLAIDIGSELDGWSTIPLYECARCRLQSFPPDLAGSAAIYERLGEYPWYYVPDKWEHMSARKDMRATDRVLEIGCGSGSFVKQLREVGWDARGTETNEQAVRDAIASGCPVTLGTVEELAIAQPHSFDVVCAFQVLEHVPHPAQFIEACLALLKPSGRLMFGVPNREGFLRHDPQHLLDLPPHHVTRWSRRSFEAFGALFPIRVVRICEEPLAEYHIEPFANIHLLRLPKVRYLSRIVCELVQRIVVPIVRVTRMNRILRGHTLYVCFELVR